MATAFQSGAFQSDAFQIDGAGPTSYSLIGNAGSYSISGGTATLKVGRQLSASAGSYSLTGGSGVLKVGRSLVANAGSYALTGGNATLTKGVASGTAYTLTALAGTYTFTGFDYVNGGYVVDDYVTGSAVMSITRKQTGAGKAKIAPKKTPQVRNDDDEVFEILMVLDALECI